VLASQDSCTVDGLLKHLEKIQQQLDICKKSLADFLDGRRRQFPRYYFTSEVRASKRVVRGRRCRV
jgi:dynein heavy chain, axonemal